MAWYPGAIRKEIPKFNTPLSSPRALILHVAVSESDSLYGYFRGASVCSHFYIRKNGIVEQYVDTRFRAPANLEANSSAISVETQGGVHNAQSEPWTDAQVQALASLSKWVSQTHGIPLTTMPNSLRSSRGIGYHRLGVNPWRVAGGEKWSSAYGKICPGNAKIAQIPGIVISAGGAVIPVNGGGNGGTVKNWLERGDTGAAVRELQRLLNAVGFSLDLDGSFGPATEAAVRAFQTSRGLIIDGFAGPQTMSALRAAQPAVPTPPAPVQPNVIVLGRGDNGDNVRRLQAHLNKHYPAYSNLSVDGNFGPATEAVVREFQRRSKIAVDGFVGPVTQSRLGIFFTKVDPAPAPKPPAPPAPPAVTVLRRGSTGPAVVRLQQTLNRNYPAYSNLKVDGSYGPATERVVREFQRRSGITVDGIAGPITQARLGLV